MGGMVRGLREEIIRCRDQQKMGGESERNNIRSCKQKYLSDKQGGGEEERLPGDGHMAWEPHLERQRGQQPGRAKAQGCEMPAAAKEAQCPAGHAALMPTTAR